MATDRHERAQRTRLVVIGIVQIVWGVLLLFLATGVALFWFALATGVLAIFLLERALYARVTGREHRRVVAQLAGRWGTVGLTVTGVLLVATGTALVFDGLGQ